MANADDKRLTGMLIKKGLNELYPLVMPIYAQVAGWTLNGTDEELPTEGEVKAVLEKYNLLKIPRISAENSLRSISQSEEEFTGPWPDYPPECGEMTTGFFDGTATFDGTTTFEG